MNALESTHVLDQGKQISLHFSNGRKVRFHAIWLRDNSLDEKTRAAGNGQRIITLAEIASNITIAKAELDNNELVVHFHPENHHTRFPAQWLLENAYDHPARQEKGWVQESLTLWDGSLDGGEVDDSTSALFEDIQNDPDTRRQWLRSVHRFGFATLRGGPIENGALCQVAELFGYIRETNYGRWFEVRTAINPSNLAYTGLGLQAHTDNPYRDPVPTLQILYCLENSAQGGENQLVDGFSVARRLQQENPHGFELLSRYCARFEYKGNGDVHLRARKPMIELSADGELISVRFNNRSTAPITDVPFDDMADYYEAYRQFGDIINDPSMAIEFKLEPGDSFIVDNTRVLHGRSGYASNEGSRWLQGCYADKDSLTSTLSVLENQHA